MFRLSQRSVRWKKTLPLAGNRFSTSSSAPVKEESFFDKAKRWTIRLSPFIAFSFVSSFVIGNLAIRHFAESLCPQYVEFLRTYYGFDDEDAVERARVAAIEASNSRPVTANVWFESGESVENVSLEGTASYNASIAQLELQHKSRVCKIVFNDSENMPPIQATSADTTDFHEQQSDVSELEASSSGKGLRAFASSSWDSVPSVEVQRKKNPLLQELNKSTVFKRYENIALLSAMDRATMAEVKESMRENYSAGRHSYLGFGRGDGNAIFTSSSPPVHTAPAAATEDTDVAKHEALQRIAHLEQNILQLKQDMQIGSRDVDSVTADIQAASKEITALKRKYVNRFYYF